jgi:hypothetical protein
MEARTVVLKMRRPFASGVGKRPAALVLSTTLLVGGTYLWQHAEVRDRQVALDRAASTAVTAQGRVAALDGRVGDLQGRISTLQRGAATLKGRFDRVSGSKHHVAARLDATAKRLDRAEARMTALIGPPLADGRYFGALIAVGANQAPPRIIIDLQRWLTGDAAQEAEIEYGVPPDARYDNFIENESPAWHTVTIAPDAAISIINMDSAEPLRDVGTGLVGTERISLERFAKMMSLHRLINPFWLAVSGGRITAIQEEYTE